MIQKHCMYFFFLLSQAERGGEKGETVSGLIVFARNDCRKSKNDYFFQPNA